MRDYTKAHPKAIFQDKPTHFIQVSEFFISPSGIRKTENFLIMEIDNPLCCFFSASTVYTSALFIIKPKA